MRRFPIPAEAGITLDAFLWRILGTTDSMPFDQIILLAIIVASSTLYATRWLPFEATSILVIAGIALTGLQPPEEALAGFASSATLTVGAMFVLSTGLVRTGALEAVTINLARLSNGSPRRLLMLLAVTVPVGSAFVNDTPVVVMLIPVVLSLSAQFGVRPVQAADAGRLFCHAGRHAHPLRHQHQHSDGRPLSPGGEAPASASSPLRRWASSTRLSAEPSSSSLAIAYCRIVSRFRS